MKYNVTNKKGKIEFIGIYNNPFGKDVKAKIYADNRKDAEEKFMKYIKISCEDGIVASLYDVRVTKISDIDEVE